MGRRRRPVLVGFVIAVISTIAFYKISTMSLPTVDPAITDVDSAAFRDQLDRLANWPLSRFAFLDAEMTNPLMLRELLAHGDQHRGAGTDTLSHVAGVPAALRARLFKLWGLALVGTLPFWLGVLTMVRARSATTRLSARRWTRGVVAGVILIAAGLGLPCVPIESPRGLVFSVLPNILGLVGLVLARCARSTASARA